MIPRSILTPFVSRPTPRRITTGSAWLASHPPPPREPSGHGSRPVPATEPAIIPTPPMASSTILCSETGLVLSPPMLQSSYFEYPSHSCQYPRPDPQLPFSTSRFVNALERRSGGTLGRGLSTGIMEVTRDLLLRAERKVANESWRRGDLENVSLEALSLCARSVELIFDIRRRRTCSTSR